MIIPLSNASFTELTCSPGWSHGVSESGGLEGQGEERCKGYDGGGQGVSTASGPYCKTDLP